MQKTKLMVEISTTDSLNVFEEEGQTKKDYIGREKELMDFRKDFAKDVHWAIINRMKEHLPEMVEEDFFNNADDVSVEGFESLDDYETKIKVTVCK